MAKAEDRLLTGRRAQLMRAAVALGALALMSLTLAAPASGGAFRAPGIETTAPPAHTAPVGA